MKFKKMIFILLVLILTFSNTAIAANNHINDVYIDVEILNDGTGVITQTWETEINEGTELFIPMENLDHMKISNYTVSDKTGPYELKENWSTKDSFEEKIGKYGILETNNGIELVFGVSQYGDNKYEIKYDFENMVQSFKDKDGFNVRFLNDQMSPAPYRVNYKIHSKEIEFSPENSKIWAFGYNGNIEFVDGDIVGRTTSELTSQNHVTVLVEMDKGLINPAFIGFGSFEEMKNEAFKGSKYETGDIQYDNSHNEAIQATSSPIGAIIGVVFAVGGLIVALIAILSSLNKKIKNYSQVEENLPIDEIPFNGEILPTFYFWTMQPEYTEENSGFHFLFAYLIKWFLNGNISENYEFLKEPENFSRLGERELKEDTEYKLWNFLLEGAQASEDGLFNKNFEKYMKSEYMNFYKILVEAKKQGEKYVIENGFLEERGNNPLVKKKYLTKSGIDEMLKILGTEEKIKSINANIENLEKPMDPKLLVLSTLFGLNPQLDMEEEFIDDYVHSPSYIYFPHHIFYANTRIVANSASNAFKSVTTSSSSSGFGGGASFGGGGGFSGGGSGGGVR